MCGSKHFPFCPLPADFRKKQREKKKEAKEKAAAKREAAKKAGAQKADKYGFGRPLAEPACKKVEPRVSLGGSLRVSKVLEPWDLLRGRDVFRDSVEFEASTCEARLSHFAPNCATFSRARELPIQGVKNPPRPLRSESFPEGIPWELAKLSRKSRSRVDVDTKLAVLSAEHCIEIHARGDFFSLEAPGRSIALNLDAWKRLMGLPGVFVVYYHNCMFRGSRRRKYQIMIVNSTSLKDHFVNTLCESDRCCTRTGLSHLKWKPLVKDGKVLQFKTGDEREYSAGFCEFYASALSDAELSGPFLEVFSGPNAPLSQAVASRMGSFVPGAPLVRSGKGVSNELNDIAHLLENEASGSPGPSQGNLLEPKAEPWLRQTAIQSGKQPSYGKRVQLIPDGLNDPELHLNRALELVHPFDSFDSLKRDHQEALDYMSSLRMSLPKRRLKTLGEIKQLSECAEVRDKQCSHEKLASASALKLGRKPRTALMEILQDRYGIEDTSVPSLCLTGMPIVGKALSSPFFFEHDVPATISVKELLSLSKKHRTTMMNRVVRMAESSGEQTAAAIWEKTVKEVAEVSMAGPFILEDIQNRHGSFFNVVPSFGLEQGVDESGKPKFRRIDDHSACLNNSAAHRTQKIEMANVDYLAIMTRSLQETFKEGACVGSEDMKGAYRQIPLPDRQVSISITAVYDPANKQAKLLEIYGQPFGAGHAVPNFYRVAEWLSRLLVRALHLLIYTCRPSEGWQEITASGGILPCFGSCVQHPSSGR